MKEIEIGTLVRVKDNLEVDKKYESVCFSEGMEKYKGAIGKIIYKFKHKGFYIYQIDTCKRPDDDDTRFGKTLEKLGFALGIFEEHDFDSAYYYFSDEMFDVIDTTLKNDYLEGTIEKSRIEVSVDKEELNKQIKDEFIQDLPTEKSIRTQITITDIDSNTYSSQIITTLAEGQDKANFALFMSTLKAIREMADRLLEIGDFPKQFEELFEKYIDLIDEDLDEFDTTDDTL